MRPSPPERLPLTPLQQGMVYHWLENPDKGFDVEQMVCTWHDPSLDVSRCRAAWEAAVRRHDALRLRIDWAGPGPGQQVAEGAIVPWVEIDLTACDGRETALDKFLHDDRAGGFDLHNGPLLRLALIRFSAAGEWRLVWTFHHLLLDGRSMVTVLHDVFRMLDGDEPVRPAFSFAPYAKWLAALDHSGSEAFWKAHLHGCASPPPTVIERLGNLTSAPAQAGCGHSLSPALTCDLREFATSHDLTLNIMVTAAWSLVISRYAGEESVIIGAARACRHSAFEHAEDTTGLLINAVPMKLDVRGSAEPVAWMQSIRKWWIDVRNHELTPLPLIRRWAGLAGDVPLFHHLVMFEHDDFTAALRRLEPSWAHREFRLRELTTVPLTLGAHGGESLRLHCAFDTSRFDPDFISRMLGHVAHVMEQLVAGPATLAEIGLTTPVERGLLLHAAQPAPQQFDGGTTLHQWFARTAALHPGRIAVSGDEVSWTYAELDGRANAIAQALIAAGVRHGSIAGLCVERRPSMVAAILGILKAGAAYLPIDPAYPPERLDFMLRDAAADVLLTERSLAAQLPERGRTVVFLDDISVAAPPPDPGAHTPDQLAYIIYTSGSTGQPKGCMIAHRNVARLMRATESWFDFGPDDVWTLFHSAAFDFSVWEMWGALLYGGRLAVVPWLTTRSPDDFYRMVCRERVTVLNQTPSAFRQFAAAERSLVLSDPSLPPPALRYVIFGGEALDVSSLAPWFEHHGDRYPQLVNMYGITETTVHVTCRPLSTADLTRGSVIGIPIPDLQLYILDPANRQPVPAGIHGEVYVGGAGLAIGYLNRRELTAERFVPNHLTGEGRLYRTGDAARFVPAARDGVPVPPGSFDIEYAGRLDDQVKIRGFRIELGEIEGVLTSHPGVRAAAVLVREDSPGDKRLCAYLVAPDRPDAGQLRNYVRRRLPDYMVPASIVFVPRFPLTAHGKLDRKALPAPQPEAIPASVSTAPVSEKEATLARIWADVLRLPQVGIHDNFFACGGDSILSIHVIARAREAGLHFTPRQLFENQTVAALAAVVTESSRRPQPAMIRDQSPIPPSPIQRWFLDQDLQGANHWNQTLLFSVSEWLDPAALGEALRAVQRHHSALRLRFVWKNNEWSQHVHPMPDEDILTVHDLAACSGPRLARQIERASGVEQARLNFEFGPLLRAAIMDCGDDGPGRLLITVHHLAIDGVSWRILMEDIESAYRHALHQRPVTLPAATVPFSEWTRRVLAWADSDAARHERPLWEAVLDKSAAAPSVKSHRAGPGANSEADAFILRTRLSAGLTSALLTTVPAALDAGIHAVLVTALARALSIMTGSRTVAFHVEGHGREAHIGGDSDVSRTIGWFTSIYPVCFELPEGTDPVALLAAVKSQLAALPSSGAGYLALGLKDDPVLLFNYLGRFDEVIAGSGLFSFAAESCGPWHSQSAARKYQIEVNAMVIGGELEIAWTAGTHLHGSETIESLAASYQTALETLIASAGDRSAVRSSRREFPMSGLDEAAIERLTAGRGVSDILPLSPMQQLFFGVAAGRPDSGWDQWHCRIEGPLDPRHLHAAWNHVVSRHSILRSTFHSAGLPHPVQVVHDGIVPEWNDIDASGHDPKATIARVLAEDAARHNDLAQPLPCRFTLVRFAGDLHFLLWSVPAIQLDGWSWPVVFSDVSEACAALSAAREPALPPVLPYAGYLKWLRDQSPDEARNFWRDYLAGPGEATPLPCDLVRPAKSVRRYRREQITLGAGESAAIAAAARHMGVSPAVMVHAAWATLLGHASGRRNVTFGAAFSGRPADLDGVERMAGPCATNLPVRIELDPNSSIDQTLHRLQAHVFDILPCQFISLAEVQDVTGVPWNRRLFDSLVVFQNYRVDDGALKLGPARLTHFEGPLHTAYALTLVVTPRHEWELMLIRDEGACSESRATRILQSVRQLLRAFIADPAVPLHAAMQAITLPADSAVSPGLAPQRPAIRIAPRSEMERKIAALWQRAFGIADPGLDDSFFDMGGNSLLMVRLHRALRDELRLDLTLVELFRYPTIGALARHLDPRTATALVPVLPQLHARAAAARTAASRVRQLRARPAPPAT